MRALGSRNYRLFFEGQTVSLIGTWMTRVATSWLVYRLTHSPFLLGLASFASQIPILFLTPFVGRMGGPLESPSHAGGYPGAIHAAIVRAGSAGAERHHSSLGNHRARVDAGRDQCLRHACAAILRGADDRAKGRSGQCDRAELVDGEWRAANRSGGGRHGDCGRGRGLLLPHRWLQLHGGHRFIARDACCSPPTHAARRTLSAELREGWQYVAESAPIRAVLLYLTLVSLVGMPYTVLMPIFAASILHGGPHTLGFLMAAAGLGALAAALSLAMRRSVLGLGRVIVWSGSFFGAGLIGLGLSQTLWLSIAVVALAGFGMMRHLASSNTILQTIVADDKRGRVMAYYSMAFQGIAPFGSLAAGALAAKIGAPRTIMIGGAACLCGALWFALRLPVLRRVLRPIYAELGILPAAHISHES